MNTVMLKKGCRLSPRGYITGTRFIIPSDFVPRGRTMNGIACFDSDFYLLQKIRALLPMLLHLGVPVCDEGKIRP